MSIMSRRFLGRARLFQELVEDWRSAPNHPLFVREVSELVEEAKEISVLAQVARDTIKKRLRERNPENIESEGAVMKQALSRIQTTLASLSEVIKNGKLRGEIAVDADAVPASVAVIERLLGDMDRWFSYLTPEQVVEAIADVKRGDFISIEDLLNEAQNNTAFGS